MWLDHCAYQIERNGTICRPTEPLFAIPNFLAFSLLVHLAMN